MGNVNKQCGLQLEHSLPVLIMISTMLWVSKKRVVCGVDKQSYKPNSLLSGNHMCFLCHINFANRMCAFIKILDDAQKHITHAI